MGLEKRAKEQVTAEGPVPHLSHVTSGCPECFSVVWISCLVACQDKLMSLVTGDAGIKCTHYVSPTAGSLVTR